MDDYLTKPMRVPELVAVIERSRLNSIPDDSPSPSTTPTTTDSTVTVDGVLDPAAVAGLVEAFGDPAVVADLVDTFLLEAPALVGMVWRAADEDRRVDVKRAAHSLKSSSAALGAAAMSATCARLETSALDAEPEAVGEAVSRAAAECELACAALVAVAADLRSVAAP